MSAAATAGGFSARRALSSSARLVAVGVTLSAVHAVTGWGIPCPWRVLTGTLCPLCGATTLGSRLLVGDLAGAWAANQFVFVLGCGFTVALVCWGVEAAGGFAVRPPSNWRSARLWWTLLAAAGIGFAVCRNIAR